MPPNTLTINAMLSVWPKKHFKKRTSFPDFFSANLFTKYGGYASEYEIVNMQACRGGLCLIINASKLFLYMSEKILGQSEITQMSYTTDPLPP